MYPSMDDLKYFIEVATVGNISRAAAIVAISQPAMSVALKRLEESLDAKLLERTNSGVVLTEIGKTVFEQAGSLIQNWENLKLDAKKSHTEVGGFFTIGAHPAVANYTFPYFLPELLADHPTLNIRIHHEDLSRKVTDAVISGKIDYGLVINPSAHPDLVIRKLETDVVRFWYHKKITNLKELENEVLICNPDLIQSKKLISKCEKLGVCFSRVVSSSSLDLVARLVENQCGVAVLPSRVLTKEQQKKLHTVIDEITFDDDICLIHKPSVSASHKVISTAISSVFS